jgi:hypothetical protein
LIDFVIDIDIDLINDYEFICLICKKWSNDSFRGILSPYLCHCVNFIVGRDKNMWTYAYKDFRNTLSRSRRLRKRIEFMLNYPSVFFVTLTLAREYSFEYVCKCVKKFLSPFEFYVANPDWGKLNGRLHWHCVLVSDFIDHNWWKLGNIDFVRVKGFGSSSRLSKYVTKLSRHALKDSVQRQKILYSRSFSKLGID